MRRPRVYLAGPDVFLPQPSQRGDALKAICARHGLEGVFPLDGSLPEGPIPDACTIAQANEAHIRGCDAVLANLTPFRGASADAGTVYEVGFARALGKPVFAYSNDAALYLQRCRRLDAEAFQDASGGWRDKDGLLIESFDLGENLMIGCALAASFAIEAMPGRLWTELVGVERCAAAIAKAFSGTPAGATG